MRKTTNREVKKYFPQTQCFVKQLDRLKRIKFIYKQTKAEANLSIYIYI